MGFLSFNFERNGWRLFQKHFMRIKLYIYGFTTYENYIIINLNGYI
jgi:hypothetical protein